MERIRLFEGCLITVLLATTCNGFRLPLSLEEGILLAEKSDIVQHPRLIRSAEEPLEKTVVDGTSTEDTQEEGFDETVDLDDGPEDKPSGKTTEEFPPDKKDIESRSDTENVELIESRAAKINIPKGLTAGAQFEPDRSGFLFGLFPFLTGRYSNRVHYRGSPPPHRHKYHPKPPHKHPIHPSTQYPHEPSHEPHGPEYEIHKPEPLPPFPPDGPHFDDYVSDFPEPLHEFPDYGDEGFHIPKKPSHPSSQEGFDNQNFEFDFNPPDFFEHSGFPHPPEEEEDYLLQNDQPYQEGGGGGGGHDLDYPLKPYSDDDEVEFYPPEDFDGFVPTIYDGPPKPHKFIPPGPKPGPPFHPPIKFIHPPDLNIIVKDGIYRGDIPMKEVHNERDTIRDDLEHGGVKGLDPEILDFIQLHTDEYINSNREKESGDGWR